MIPFMTRESSTGERSLSVFIDNKMYPVDGSHPKYDRLIQALNEDDLETVRAIVAVKAAIVKQSCGRLELIDETMYCDGREVHNSVIPRIISMIGQGFNVKPMMLFLSNLLDNPSKSSVEDTYEFLEACSLPITEDGHFLAYKSVNKDFTDMYTGTFDNSIGKTVSMPRNECDEDNTRTCSTGLHVCSQGYLPQYGGFYGREDGHTLVVKVNPRDVVAVPNDYNNAKMRTCKYVVIDEVFGLETIEDDFKDTSSFEFGGNETVDCDDYDNYDNYDNYDDYDDYLDCDGADFGTIEDDSEDITESTPSTPPVKKPTPTRTKVTELQAFDIHSQRNDGWTLQCIATANTTPEVNMSIRQVRRVLSGELHPEVKERFERNN